MNQVDLAYISVEFIISVAVILFCVVTFFKKSRLIKWEQATESKKNWVRRHEKRLNNICYMVLLVMSIVVSINITVPYLLDFPCIINGSYLIITGKAKTADHGGRNSNQKREIEIIDNNGDSKRISFFSEYINQGEAVTVVYLPHLKYGTRID